METKVLYKEKQHSIDTEKLLKVISTLENKEIKYESEEQILTYLKKYDLYDEVFLENINKL